MKKDAGTIIFTHIPKTAGITMHTILHRQYIFKWGNIFYAANLGKIDRIRLLSEKFRRNLILVKGHLYFGVHNYVPGPVSYFTFLRDPVARTISMYNHLYVSPRTPYYKEMKEKQYTLDDLLENGFVLNMDNCQVRFLCGIKDISFGEVNEEHLAIAMNNLTNYYKGGVGITEHFDESLLLLKKRFNWRMPWYVKQNVGEKQRIKPSEVSPATMEKLKYYNRYDEILYQKALEMFRQEVADAGPSFKNEVAVFKKENERKYLITKIATSIFTHLHFLRFYTGTQKE